MIIKVHVVQKLWKSKLRGKKKLAERREKKQIKTGPKKEEDNSIPIDQVITLDHLTNPNKK